jgi:hypothetical protein
MEQTKKNDHFGHSSLHIQYNIQTPYTHIIYVISVSPMYIFADGYIGNDWNDLDDLYDWYLTIKFDYQKCASSFTELITSVLDFVVWTYAVMLYISSLIRAAIKMSIEWRLQVQIAFLAEVDLAPSRPE